MSAPPVEIMVLNDGFLELLAEAMDGDRERIQGFLYADHHVIRDLHKPWDQQEIWRRAGEYEATHAAMMRQIKVERLRIAVARAFAMAENPWPGQEQAAAQVRATLDEAYSAQPASSPEVTRQGENDAG